MIYKAQRNWGGITSFWCFVAKHFFKVVHVVAKMYQKCSCTNVIIIGRMFRFSMHFDCREAGRAASARNA